MMLSRPVCLCLVRRGHLSDLTRLYPDRELDMVAVSSIGLASGAGEVNYSYIGGYFAKLLSEGLYGALRRGRDAFDKVKQFSLDTFDRIDESFFDDLGRQESPYWGSDEWNRTLVPSGYIDRFDAAADVTVIVLGGFLARLILGKVGISGVASFAGGLYGKLSTKAWKNEISEALELIQEGQESSSFRLANRNQAQFDALVETLMHGMSGVSNNDSFEVFNAVQSGRAILSE